MKKKSVQIHPRISPAIARELKKAASLRRVAEKSIVEAALEVFLSQTEHEALILKSMYEIQRKVERLEQEQSLTLETLATLVRVYVTHTPEIPADQKARVEHKGRERFEKFINIVRRSLSEDRMYRNCFKTSLEPEEEA